MPYVPPHLRNRDSASGAQPSSSDTGDRQESSGYGGGRGGGRYDGGGRGGPRDGTYSPHGGMSRSSSYQSLPRNSSYGNLPRNASYGRLADSERRGPTEPIFVEWKPSERVQGLSDEQIAEIRQRLNVTVQVPSGKNNAVSPIESFKEMVRMRIFRKTLVASPFAGSLYRLEKLESRVSATGHRGVASA